MDKAEAIRIAQQYLELLTPQYEIEEAIIFGSFAKGTNHADSDIDLAIVLNNVKDIIDTQIDMMKLRRKVDLRIEPHPFNLEDFNITNPVVNEILNHGIKVSQVA